jgi:hypothetical protein
MKRKFHVEPSYGPLTDVCRSFGISRSVAYELVADGLLETFKLNARRYVYIDSVRSLPRRISIAGGTA